MSISATSGTVALDRREQRRDVADGTGDLEAVRGQDLVQAVADQRGVVGYDDAHGISARIVVPAPGAVWTVNVPLRAPTRSARPCSPLPARGSAPPCPSSATSTTSRPSTGSIVTLAARAWACLVMFASASETTK